MYIILFFLSLLNTFVYSTSLPQVEKNFRIIGGKIADRNKWEFLGSLSNDSIHYCGVTLIDSNCCLTAAHCVTDDRMDDMESIRQRYLIDYSSWYVRFGVFNISSKEGLNFDIENIFVYPDFDRTTLQNDIALIKLKKSVTETLHISPVKLALHAPKRKTMCETAGWGRILENNDQSIQMNESLKNDVIMQNENRLETEIALKERILKAKLKADELQEVELPVIHRKLCNKIYRNRITHGMLCTLLETGGKDACEGDSGGPLICNGKQAGIISWGDECGGSKSPGVYTNIAYFQTWLKNKCNEMKTPAVRKSKTRQYITPELRQDITSIANKTQCIFTILLLFTIICSQ